MNTHKAFTHKAVINSKTKSKRVMSCLLIAALLAFAITALASQVPVPPPTAADPDLSYEKEETVYGALDASGEVRALYVVNTLQSEQSGIAADYGRYSELSNLSGADGLSFNPDEQTIGVTLTAAEPFMYQGRLIDTELPWLFTIRYTIDDVPVDPSELGGKSGKLGIMVGAVKNAEAADTSYFDNYALQVSLALSKNLCRNVTVGGATLADAGSSRQVTATALPDSCLYFTVEADVTDFEMGSVTIAAAPFSMKIKLPDMDAMLGQFDQLTDGSEQIEGALSTIVESLNAALNGDEESGQAAMPSMSQMNLGMTMMNSALTGTSRQLGQMETGLSALSDSINQLVSVLPTETIDTESLEALYASVTDLDSKELLDQLTAGYAAAAAAGAALTEAQPQAAAFSSAIAPLRSGLDTVSTNLSQAGTLITDMAAQAEGLTQLLDGLSQLNDQYALFHAGIASIPDQATAAIDDVMSSFDRGGYRPNSFADERNGQVKALQFTLRTDAITVPTVALADEPVSEPETFIERLTKLFR
ncbi:hypothetical protein FACS1894184_11900 [Clostridia bacterium]|nr:hypothetical protein FACS1894184_11900 [Clostridia bacterium]